MKIVCDCGAVHEFSDFDEYTQEYNEYDDCIGATYNTIKGATFWEADHDSIGLKCNTCDKAIWFFI